MQKITSTSGLKDAIRLLEDQQDLQGKLLKEQFYFFTESLKPINLIKSAFSEVITSPDLSRNILNISIGIITSLFASGVIKGPSGNIIKKLLGNILKIGVPFILANNREAIQSLVQNILHRVFQKREKTIQL
jgi:hypothetical protein